MNKPKVIVLHPRDWCVSEYGKNSSLDLHHVYIGGNEPKKKSGLTTYDGYADVVKKEGVIELEKKFKKLKPNVFLFWIHAGFSPGMVASLKKISPKTKFVMWYGNHRYKFPKGVAQHRGILDAVVLNSKDPGQYKMYLDNGIPHVGTLYDGFNPDVVPFKDIEPEFDCVFGGNSYLKRSEMKPGLDFPGGGLRYNMIMEARKKFNIGVFSDSPAGWPFKCLEPSYHPKYTNELRRGKITLNVNHFPDLVKAYTRRTIRSIFCGRLHITLYIPGMEDDFENHKNIVWYHNISEALDLIDYYLKHDDEREEIAQEMYKHACENFTFKHRLEDFEKMVKVLL